MDKPFIYEYGKIEKIPERNTMSEKIYPQGIKSFNPHKNAPDFVKATILVCPNLLARWCNEHSEYMSDYKGEPQIKLVLKDGSKGLYLEADIYKSSMDKGGASSPEKYEREYEATKQIAEQVKKVEEQTDDELPF